MRKISMKSFGNEFCVSYCVHNRQNNEVNLMKSANQPNLYHEEGAEMWSLPQLTYTSLMFHRFFRV